MKMVNAFLIIFFIFLLSVRITYAKDFSIVLDDTTPSFQQVDNFFNSDDMLWAPGKEETKSLIITNNTNIAQYILFSSINKDDPILVSQAMHITISNKSGDELYSNSLFAFINQGEKLIDSVEPYSTETLIFNIKMYDTAGNIYQNSYINFDLGIDLLDPIEYITPTPILCNTSIPPPISQLTLGKIGSDQVLVEWNKGYRDDEKESKNQDSITGYSVMYATNNSFNPNTQRYIGKTNQFIVKYVDLKSNRYYFKVKTVNNCKEGDWSSVISVGTAETTSISAQTTP
ncbi:MAG: fibronectin type III domain-containing protein, partial [bacterium]|nr:fibronectin type III domain-containing protein [bacterium]